jgi:polar amino acid transport system substrate-binding protein
MNDDDRQGVVSHLVREAFAEVDIDIAFGFYPWSRGYELAKNNLWDGAAAWACLESRQQDFYFSDPLLPINYVFFHRKGVDFDWQSVDDLTGLTVAVTEDYSYYGVLESAIERDAITAYISPTDEQNFRMLAEGRVDLFPMDAMVGAYMLSRELTHERFNNISFHPRSLRTDHLHLMLSRKNPANRERMIAFNEGLARLRQSGRFNAIVENMLGLNAAALMTRLEPVTNSACDNLDLPPAEPAPG